VARFILGLGVGLSSSIVPVLLAEISPISSKGTITSVHQLMITFGILIISVLSNWMTHVKHGWWWMNCVFVFSSGAFLFITGFILPESPLWLLKKGLEEESFDVLARLRASHDYQSDLNNASSSSSSSSSSSPSQQKDNEPLLPHNPGFSTNGDKQRIHSVTSGLYSYDLDHLMSNQTQDTFISQEFQNLKLSLYSSNTGTSEVGWLELFTSKRYRKQLFIGIGLMLSSSLIGINAVIMFSTKIFGFAGLENDRAIYGSIGVGVASFLMSFASLILIEKFGRRTLFMIGSGGCTIALPILGGVLLALNNESQKNTQGILAVVFLLAYIVFFNTGLGGVPWTLLPEITSSAVRSKLQSFFCFLNWFANFGVVLSTLPIVTLLGGGSGDAEQKKGAAILFLIFGGVALCTFLFGSFILIETKGKTEPQIQLQLGNDESHSIEVDGDSHSLF
jgi:MFS family permease